MILKFKPGKYYKSIFDVDFEKLKKEGIKLVACDLDNTLVPHDVLTPSQQVIDLVKEIEDMGLKFIVMSNNGKKRVEKFCKKLNIDYYYSSKKPLKITFKKILKDYQYKDIEICLVGDQILTDVFGANGMNMMSVLVEPLAHRDIIYTKVNRIIEKRIIKKLEKKEIFKVGEYYE